MGTFAVLTLRAPSRRKVRWAAIWPTSSGDSSLLQRIRDRVPVVALHRRAFNLRDGHRRNRAVGALRVANEAVGIRQHLVADGRVEGAALGIDDARIDIQGGLLGATGIVDAIGGGERIDILVVEIEVGLQLAQLRGLGNSPRTDLRW